MEFLFHFDKRLLADSMTGVCYSHSVRFEPCVERTPGHAGVGADIGDGLAGLVAGDQRLLCFCADAHDLIPPVKWCRIPL